MFISFQDHTVQGLCDPFVLCPCVGKKITVRGVHIRLRNISNGEKSLQHALFVPNGKRYNAVLPHKIPGIFQRHGFVHLRADPNIHVFYLRANVSNIPRSLYAKIIQHILGLLIDLSGPLRNIFLFLHSAVFDIRIGNG